MATATQGEGLRVPKGSVIFRQGDPGHEMFVISEGRVRLTLGRGGLEKEIAVLGTGEFFGELSLLSDAPRSATATAVEDTVLLAISRDVFAMLVQDDLDIVFRMMNIQGQRLSQTNLPIEGLARRLGRVRIGAHCLRRLLVPNLQLPVTFEIEGVARETADTAEAVHTTVQDLVQRGVGSLNGERWTIENREQMERLAAALSAYAETGAGSGQGS